MDYEPLLCMKIVSYIIGFPLPNTRCLVSCIDHLDLIPVMPLHQYANREGWAEGGSGVVGSCAMCG